MLDLTAPPDCTAACSSLPTRLVLCRHSENVDWAIPPAEGASYELLVYNNGEPLTSLPAHVQQQRIPNVGREAFCHLLQLLTVKRTLEHCGEHCAPEHVILAQAAACLYPTANKLVAHGGAACRAVVEDISSALGRREAHLAPRGQLVPLQSVSIGYVSDLPPVTYGKLACWEKDLSGLLMDSPRLAHAIITASRALQLGYARGANYIVGRDTILNTPTRWLTQAVHHLLTTRPLPWTRNQNVSQGSGGTRRFNGETLLHQAVCCPTNVGGSEPGPSRRHTCWPWILERFWSTLMGPGHHRGDGAACSDAHGGGGHNCKHFEGNFAAAKEAWVVRRHTFGMHPKEFEALMAAADAENAGIEPRLTKAFDEVQRVLQRDWNQSMLLSRPRPDVARCTGKKCVGVKGRIRGREFDRSDTTPYFERGGALQCVPNATLLVESVPHLVNFSTTSTSECKTCTLEHAVRRYWENCMDWRILLWPTGEGGAPPPDMWAVSR